MCGDVGRIKTVDKGGWVTQGRRQGKPKEERRQTLHSIRRTQTQACQHWVNFLSMKFTSLARLSNRAVCSAYAKGLLLPQQLWVGYRGSVCCSLLSFMCQHAFSQPLSIFKQKKKQQQKNKTKTTKNCILHTPTLLCNHCTYVGLTQQYRSPFLTEITNFCHKQENTRTIDDIYPASNKGCMWMTKILGANPSSHSAMI